MAAFQRKRVVTPDEIERTLPKKVEVFSVSNSDDEGRNNHLKQGLAPGEEKTIVKNEISDGFNVLERIHLS
ncbi:hypothetical protein TNCV_3170161 [Trichonephila clavipes]|nr:hypothetical protein TNCV_3170161 [Trichonephila clavipes]